MMCVIDISKDSKLQSTTLPFQGQVVLSETHTLVFLAAQTLVHVALCHKASL